jgi:hypothetical protein
MHFTRKIVPEATGSISGGNYSGLYVAYAAPHNPCEAPQALRLQKPALRKKRIVWE